MKYKNIYIKAQVVIIFLALMLMILCQCSKTLYQLPAPKASILNMLTNVIHNVAIFQEGHDYLTITLICLPPSTVSNFRCSWHGILQKCNDHLIAIISCFTHWTQASFIILITTTIHGV